MSRLSRDLPKPQFAGDAGAPLFDQRSPVLGVLRVSASFVALLAVVWFAEVEPLRLWIGLALIAAGEWFHAWGHGHLVKNKELITSGPYGRTQNPLYFGRILMASGFFVAVKLPFGLEWGLLAASWVLFLGYYMPRKTKVEGRRLRAFHGSAWEDYNAHVPVLFPALQRWTGAAADRFSFEVMLLRNREWGMFLGLGATVAVLLWKAFR